MGLPTIKLADNKSEIPVVGFGSGTKWQWKKKEANTAIDRDLVDSLKSALKAGLTHLDTAEFYTTREDVGVAIAEAIAEKIIKSRNDVFVTDKYAGKLSSFTSEGKIRGPYESAKECLKLMKIDYLDMFLFHTQEVNPKLTLETQWQEMVQLKKEGLVKIIGVSNFDVKALKVIKSFGLEMPQVLQIEFHPYLQSQSPQIKEFAHSEGIQLEAYGPLVPLTKARKAWTEKFEGEPPLDPLLRELEEKYGKSQTQILLNYALQNDYIPITTTSKAERMQDILGIFTWEINVDDVQRISDAGNSWFYRAFAIPPLPEYDEALKKERGLI